MQCRTTIYVYSHGMAPRKCGGFTHNVDASPQLQRGARRLLMSPMSRENTGAPRIITPIPRPGRAAHDGFISCTGRAAYRAMVTRRHARGQMPRESIWRLIYTREKFDARAYSSSPSRHDAQPFAETPSDIRGRLPRQDATFIVIVRDTDSPMPFDAERVRGFDASRRDTVASSAYH